MAGYMVYWASDYIKSLQKAKDNGPLKVVYGSQHTTMPDISSVRVGDVIYPVTLKDGTLAVMARLAVERIECAFDYLMREVGTYQSSLIPAGVLYHKDGTYGDFVMWEHGSGYFVDETHASHMGKDGKVIEELPANIERIYYENQLEEVPHLPHQEPKSCCAKTAASGTGTEICPRIIPIETVSAMLFGKTKSTQKPLKLDKNGRLTAISLAGFVRKMSDDTFEIFESLFR